MLPVYLPVIFTTLVTRLPIILILLAGFILALVRWQKHRQVSILMIIIFAVELFIALPLSITPAILAASQHQTGMNVQQISALYSILSIAGTLISSLVWILAIIAIFGWRQKNVVTFPPTYDKP
jgi:hypothetical protein